jgi:hypothetical protein
MSLEIVIPISEKVLRSREKESGGGSDEGR